MRNSIAVLAVLTALGVTISGSVFANREQDSENTSMYVKQEISCDNNGRNIYGVAYIPPKSGKLPLVILSHGLGTTHTIMEDYAESIASHGAAAYIFDFCGGSENSKSDGKTTEMSVMTEVSDIEAIMAAAKNWSFVDPNNIVLIGDNIRDMYPSKDTIPDKFSLFGWVDVGRIYAEDIWDYDPYTEIGNYKKPVLIVHGDKDVIVDISYSDRAVDVYENAKLQVIKGADHAILYLLN